MCSRHPRHISFLGLVPKDQGAFAPIRARIGE
ncbi:Uncharacterised protein [Chlamydia trachomatis]|nr:Uncharacterised protein [Chlamydia trachomatis]